MVERAGVEPACRLFSVRYYFTYSRTITGGTHRLPVSHIKTGLSSQTVRRITVGITKLWAVWESNPPFCVGAPQQCFSHLNLPSNDTGLSSQTVRGIIDIRKTQLELGWNGQDSNLRSVSATRQWSAGSPWPLGCTVPFGRNYPFGHRD